MIVSTSFNNVFCGCAYAENHEKMFMINFRPFTYPNLWYYERAYGTSQYVKNSNYVVCYTLYLIRRRSLKECRIQQVTCLLVRYHSTLHWITTAVGLVAGRHSSYMISCLWCTIKPGASVISLINYDRHSSLVINASSAISYPHFPRVLKIIFCFYESYSNEQLYNEIKLEDEIIFAISNHNFRCFNQPFDNVIQVWYSEIFFATFLL